MKTVKTISKAILDVITIYEKEFPLTCLMKYSAQNKLLLSNDATHHYIDLSKIRVVLEDGTFRLKNYEGETQISCEGNILFLIPF